MNRVRKILLLVEGTRLEVKLLNKAFHEYHLDMNYEIYPYKTNIYELYERMFKGNESDLEALDLLGTLRERDQDNKILKDEFSDILLIFDYEPQDNRFSQERINLLLDYFNESTDNGKLYINYPMVESFKHLKANPDEDYKIRVVDFACIAKYKQVVASETIYPDINLYGREHFDLIILHNIKKANYIVHQSYEIDDFKACYYELVPKHILLEQNKYLQNVKKIHVLNTCLFFICDYKIDLLFQ